MPVVTHVGSVQICIDVPRQYLTHILIDRKRQTADIVLCRSCVTHLMAAADEVCSADEEAAKELSAQRAARCMQLLQDMIRTCKV